LWLGGLYGAQTIVSLLFLTSGASGALDEHQKKIISLYVCVPFTLTITVNGCILSPVYKLLNPFPAAPSGYDNFTNFSPGLRSLSQNRKRL